MEDCRCTPRRADIVDKAELFFVKPFVKASGGLFRKTYTKSNIISQGKRSGRGRKAHVTMTFRKEIFMNRVMLLTSAFLSGTLGGVFARRAALKLSGNKGPAAGLSINDLPSMLLLGLFCYGTLFLSGRPDPAVIGNWIFAGILLAASVTDIRCYRIPDRMILYGIALWLSRVIFLSLGEGRGALGILIRDGLPALACGVVLLGLSIAADRLFGKETLGGGDIKLIVLITLHLGFFRSLLSMIPALLSALVFLIVRKGKRLPFGPFLSFGAAVLLLCGKNF